MDSYVAGPTNEPLLGLTIGAALDDAVRRWANAEAVVSSAQCVRLTWAELREAADAIASGLLALGVVPGDRVGIWAPNCVEWVITQFATARAGIILVNINPAYRTSEVEFTLRKVGVKVLICAHQFKSSNYVAMIEELLAGSDLLGGTGPAARLPSLNYVVKLGGEPRAGWLDFAGILSSGRVGPREDLPAIGASLAASDPISIQFTSGTTGQPKGATLSHRNILNNAWFSGLGMGLRVGDRMCIPLPLYHCFGMVLGNLACLVHGATMIYASAGFDPLAVLRTVAQEKCTVLHGVPTMFIAELEHPDFNSFDLSSLRTGLMGGSPCPVEVMRKIIDRMHMTDVGIAYGMTEMSPASFQTAVDDSVERRVSTIGRVHPHVQAKIVDPLTGQIVPRGQPGELCTSGYSVMLGYWDEPGMTAEAVREGWMHTGDLAVIDAEGYGSIVGRIKDMIIRGGENVYPREIEECLFAHPHILDVQVVGVPDAKYGEEICACVKLRAGAPVHPQSIIEFCRGRIAHYKVPRHVLFCDDFPLTVSGKVQKYVLREQAAARIKQSA